MAIQPSASESTNKGVEEDLFEALAADHMGQDVHAGKKVEEGEGPWLVSYADLMTLLMGFFALIASFSKPDIKAFEAVKKSAAEKFGGTYSEPYQKVEKAIYDAIRAKGLQDKVSVSRAVDGVTLKFDGKTLFDSGEFIIKDEGVSVLNVIVTAIQADITKYKMIIEGHTDNVPMSHPIIASNWELSAIRAARIAQLMEGRSFKKEQLTIQGWGETKPEVPNLDSTGQPIIENQAKNRRVIVKIFE
jgi:chemotaxis protein MotB